MFKPKAPISGRLETVAGVEFDPLPPGYE